VLIRLTPIADSEVFANHELHQQDPGALDADDPALVVVQHYEPRLGSLRVPASATEAQELRRALFDWGNALDQHVERGLSHRDVETKRVYRAVRDGLYKAAEKIDADRAGRRNPSMPRSPRHPRPRGPRGGTTPLTGAGPTTASDSLTPTAVKVIVSSRSATAASWRGSKSPRESERVPCTSSPARSAP
jgi:hypothetical protein